MSYDVKELGPVRVTEQLKTELHNVPVSVFAHSEAGFQGREQSCTI